MHRPHVSLLGKVPRDVCIWFSTYCILFKDNTGEKTISGAFPGGGGGDKLTNWHLSHTLSVPPSFLELSCTVDSMLRYSTAISVLRRRPLAMRLYIDMRLCIHCSIKCLCETSLIKRVVFCSLLLYCLRTKSVFCHRKGASSPS